MSQTRMAGISHVGTKDTAKGPLFQVTTTDGTEYSTFNGALANQARQLVGQQVVLAFTEKHVNKDGRDYVNRYFDGAEATNGGGMQTIPGFGNTLASNGGSEMPQLAAPPAENMRETRIMRQTATKVAAHMLVYLPETERTPDGLVAIAEYLVSYYENGPRTAAPSMPPASSTFYDTQPPTDDIPF